MKQMHIKPINIFHCSMYKSHSILLILFYDFLSSESTPIRAVEDLRDLKSFNCTIWTTPKLFPDILAARAR